MHPARLAIEEALSSLRSQRDGLGAAEAARRALEYGPNRLEESRTQPAPLRLARA